MMLLNNVARDPRALVPATPRHCGRDRRRRVVSGGHRFPDHALAAVRAHRVCMGRARDGAFAVCRAGGEHPVCAGASATPDEDGGQGMGVLGHGSPEGRAVRPACRRGVLHCVWCVFQCIFGFWFGMKRDVVILMLLFACCLGLYTPFWYIELFMLSRGSSASLAFYTIAIMNAAGVIGRIGSGYIADRVRIHSSVRSSFCFPSPPPPLRVSAHPFSPFSSCRALSLVTSLKFTQTSNADTFFLFFSLS